MLYVFVLNFNIIVYSQFIQSDIQVCCSIKNINTEYLIFLPFASRAVGIHGGTHIPSDMSIGIHKPQGYLYHCDIGEDGKDLYLICTMHFSGFCHICSSQVPCPWKVLTKINNYL